MRIKLFLLFLLLFLIITAYAKAPEWVRNRPIDNNYYIGIGYAPKIKGNNDHLEKAKNEALKNLASEITINISGEIVSDMVEKSGMLEEELRSRITSTTQAELEGYEVVDEWQDKKQYYIYYRLSKAKYSQARIEKINKAISLALDLFDRGRNSETQKEYSLALSFYLQALMPLDKYITEPLKTDYNGRPIYLSNEIYSSLQNLLSNIEFTAINAKLAAKRNSAVKELLKIKATYSEQAISNLPVNFEFTRGDGDLQKKAHTNIDGIASSKIILLKSNDKLQFVKASLDLSKLIDQENTNFVYEPVLQSYPIPETKFILTVSGLSFSIDSTELNLGQKMAILQVEPRLKEALSSEGYSFTDDISNADIYIEINAQSRQGSELYGMFSAFVDMTVSVNDMNSGEEIYKNVFSNITGQGLDYEKAGLNAFNKAAEEFATTMKDILKK